MPFPSFEHWVKHVLNPKMTTANPSGYWKFDNETWYKNYQLKYHIAKMIAPRSILEIGVLYGFSAHAFLCAGESISYLGIDINDPSFNDVGEPTLDIAAKMLNHEVPRVPPAYIETRVCNTQKEELTDLGNYDFVHVDACHTYQGCYRDIRSAWPHCNRAVLVDDYVTNGGVHDAVDKFIQDFGATLLITPAISGSQNGEALIIR